MFVKFCSVQRSNIQIQWSLYYAYFPNDEIFFAELWTLKINCIIVLYKVYCKSKVSCIKYWTLNKTYILQAQNFYFKILKMKFFSQNFKKCIFFFRRILSMIKWETIFQLLCLLVGNEYFLIITKICNKMQQNLNLMKINK